MLWPSISIFLQYYRDEKSLKTQRFIQSLLQGHLCTPLAQKLHITSTIRYLLIQDSLVQTFGGEKPFKTLFSRRHASHHLFLRDFLNKLFSFHSKFPSVGIFTGRMEMNCIASTESQQGGGLIPLSTLENEILFQLHHHQQK